MSSDCADRNARQVTNAGQDGDALRDDPTVILSPLASEANQVVAGSIPQSPVDDLTVILPPLAQGAGRDQAVMGNVPQPPEDDMTVILPPLARGAARDQVVTGTIPQQPPGFLPRPTLLAELDRPGRAASVVRVLTGMRGVGKTQLAAAYARAKLAAGWRLVAWINAEDTGCLLAGLAAVADATGLANGDPGRDAAALGRMIRRRLEADGERCLLVFDDAEDPDVIRPFVPAVGAVRVLITSTRQRVANLGSSVPVDVFREDEALAFLTERTGLGETEAAAVAGELGRLPLALAQAAAVMAGRREGHETYLKQLRAVQAKRCLAQGQEKDQQPYPLGVVEAILLSTEAVRSDSPKGVCSGVLEIMAVLSAAGVCRELLYAAGTAGVLAKRRLRSGVSAAVVDRALARLAERSLLTFSLDGRRVIAHSLVMRLMRQDLARRGRLAEVCWAAASVLDARAEALTGSRDREAVRDIPEQVTALRDNAAGPAAESDSELAKVLLLLQFWALYHLNELGDSAAQAIAVGEPLVADFERRFGPDHPETLGLRNSLALAYLAAGRTAEAVRLLEHILASQKRLLGFGHPDTLTTRNSLAAAYQAAGRAGEAIRLYGQILADRERLLGFGHPDTLTTRNSLAAAYQAAGRAGEAIRLYEEILADRERLLGFGHPDTLTTKNNLAAAYWDAGRGAQAIRLFEQTLASREGLLGIDHPRTLTSRGNLAAAYKASGRAAEAVPLFEQTLAEQEHLLGPDHPDTLTTQNNLAAAYRDVGLADEAIRLFEQTLAAREHLLGANHPETLATLKSLAATRREAGRAE